MNDKDLIIEQKDNIYIARHPDYDDVVATGTTPESARYNFNIFFELVNICNGGKNEK